MKSNLARLPVLAVQARAGILAGLLFSFIQVANAAPIEVSLGPLAHHHFADSFVVLRWAQRHSAEWPEFVGRFFVFE